jgi:hypothetical protein
LDISHFTIAAAGALPANFGSAKSVLNFLSSVARPTPPMVFMAMVPKSFCLSWCDQNWKGLCGQNWNNALDPL